MAKWRWRSKSMTPFFNTTWYNPKIHIWESRSMTPIWQIWWYQFKSVTSYHVGKVKFTARQVQAMTIPLRLDRPRGNKAPFVLYGYCHSCWYPAEARVLPECSRFNAHWPLGKVITLANYWLFTNEVLRHSAESNFTSSAQAIILHNEFEK